MRLPDVARAAFSDSLNQMIGPNYQIGYIIAFS
jgi:hypothetical protein